MPRLQIIDTVDTGQHVTADHFNGNAIFVRNTDDGVPDPSYVEAVNELGIQTVRYPAGEVDIAYAAGLLIGGSLPDHVVAFLDAARENGLQVVMVTPTVEGYRGPEELNLFANLLLESYGDVVHAFEVGNEYWNHQDEYEYGQIANDSLIALDQAISEQNLNIDIWIQMGDAGGQASAFHEGEGWIPRHVMANQAILSQLSDEAQDIIDGVVEHYYFRIAQQHLGDLTDADQLIGMDYTFWQNALGHDISLNITEWNIRTTNYFQHGMRAASTMVAQFEFLVNLEVDEMYVWPPQHNAATDLAGANGVLLDPITGVVVNTIGGAVFDLMSSSLVGMESIAVAQENEQSNVQSHVFANDNQIVVYVTSRSNSVEDVSFSLGDFWLGAALSSALQVGYDQSSSDGQFYHHGLNEWATAESVIVDGEVYYLNEHDVNAQITEHDVDNLVDGGNVVFELRPYEIIELIFELPDEPVISGSAADDVLQGSDVAEYLIGLAGSDVITAGGGADTIDGGSGSDYINSGSDHDVVEGGSGDDSIYGWGGQDSLVGGFGDDIIGGWHGADTLVGGVGNDTLNGGAGADDLFGGFGDDLVLAGAGDDTVHYSSGADALYGGDGNDTFILSGTEIYGTGFAAQNTISDIQFGTGQLISVGGLSQVEAVVYGGQGQDTVLLSAGDDAYFLEDVLSAIHQEVPLTADGAVGVNLGRLSSIEMVNSGRGNDLLDMTSIQYSIAGHSMELLGGIGNDTIWGSDADDLILGGSGDDVIFGGEGHNILTGGAGSDRFQITASSYNTTISDFDPLSGDCLEIFEIDDFQFDGYSLTTNENEIQLNFGHSNGTSSGEVIVQMDNIAYQQVVLDGGFLEDFIFLF